MTSVFNFISPAFTTTFSSIPTIVTQVVSDISARLASTAFVQANVALLNPALYLNTNTDQTLTGSGFGFLPAQSVTEVDTINVGDTLAIGVSANTGINVGQNTSTCNLYIKSFLQPVNNIWKLWAIGNTNTTTSTGTAVLAKKVLSGSFAISSTSTPIAFPIGSYTSKPAVFLCIRSTAGTVVFPNRWVTSVSSAGFTANTTTTSPTLIMNWYAIGD